MDSLQQQPILLGLKSQKTPNAKKHKYFCKIHLKKGKELPYYLSIYELWLKMKGMNS